MNKLNELMEKSDELQEDKVRQNWVDYRAEAFELFCEDTGLTYQGGLNVLVNIHKTMRALNVAEMKNNGYDWEEAIEELGEQAFLDFMTDTTYHCWEPWDRIAEFYIPMCVENDSITKKKATDEFKKAVSFLYDAYTVEEEEIA